MTFDINSPFYQNLISEGTKRGYTPMAIAASIGNASAENGGQTSGMPGDNGTAFGAMQWRGPRWDGVKATAQSMGVPWTDPGAQASYWWDEQDGKYPSAASASAGQQLRNATTLDGANQAVINSLKPAGWKPGLTDYSGISQIGTRAGNTQLAYSAMQKAGLIGDGGGNGAALDPDAPVPGALPTAGQGSPGNGSDPSSILYAGPQNVPAQAPQVQRPPESFGHRLMLAGAALMARDNPKGAEALSSAANSDSNDALQWAQLAARQNATQSTVQNWADHGTVGDGAYTRQTDQYGNTRYIPVPKEAQDTQAADNARKADMQLFQDNAGQMTNDRQMINTAMQLKENLLNGKMSVTAGPQGIALVQNYTGSAGPNTRDLKNMEALWNVQVRNILAMEKGSATDQKIKQAMQQVLPNGGQYDDTQVYDALDRLSDGLRGRYSAAANTNRAYAQRFPNMASQAHGLDGKPIDLGASYDGDLQRWQGQQDDYDKRKDAFFARHDAQNGRQAPKPSFLDYYGSQNGGAPGRAPEAPPPDVSPQMLQWFQ